MSKCTECKNMSFSMSDFRQNLNKEGKVVSIEECIEYICDECSNRVYKYVLYKPVDGCVTLNCKKCNSNDKAYVVFVDIHVLEGVDDGNIGDSTEVKTGLRCKCSIFKPKTLIKAEFIIDEVKFIEEKPEWTN